MSTNAKGGITRNDLLKLLYNAVPIANMADNAATSPHTVIYVALHTASPGSAGDQTTNECAYPNYTRIGVARTAGGWTVVDNEVNPVASIDFPEAGVGASETATYFSTGLAASGASKILHQGEISPGMAIAEGSTPKLGTGTTIREL